MPYGATGYTAKSATEAGYKKFTSPRKTIASNFRPRQATSRRVESNLKTERTMGKTSGNLQAR